MEITKNKSNFLSGLGEEIQKQPRFYFNFFFSLKSGESREQGWERQNVAVSGLYDAVSMVDEYHSHLFSLAFPVAPSPQRRASSRHGRVRFRWQGQTPKPLSLIFHFFFLFPIALPRNSVFIASFCVRLFLGKVVLYASLIFLINIILLFACAARAVVYFTL